MSGEVLVARQARIVGEEVVLPFPWPGSVAPVLLWQSARRISALRRRAAEDRSIALAGTFGVHRAYWRDEREKDMNDHDAEERPQVYARIAGLLYFFVIAAAGFGELFVRSRLIRWGDAAATAGNILASETLFRAGLAAEMLTCVCDVALAVILYVLLRPVSRNLAMLAAFFRLTFVGVYSVAKLFEVAALVTLGGAGNLKALAPEQLHDFAYVSLRVHSLGYGASLLFFGFCCILLGHLIQKSGYLPRAIGIALGVAGYGYAAFSITQMLSPRIAARIVFPWIMPVAFVAESALALWLLVRGVNTRVWSQRTQGRRESMPIQQQ